MSRVSFLLADLGSFLYKKKPWPSPLKEKVSTKNQKKSFTPKSTPNQPKVLNPCFFSTTPPPKKKKHTTTTIPHLCRLPTVTRHQRQILAFFPKKQGSWVMNLLLLLMAEIRRSPVEVGSWNPIIYRVLDYIPGGARFQPSTVLPNPLKNVTFIRTHHLNIYRKMWQYMCAWSLQWE